MDWRERSQNSVQASITLVQERIVLKQLPAAALSLLNYAIWEANIQFDGNLNT